MTFFTGAIGLLVVAVIGVFLLPRLWASRQAGETTLDWLALRDAELSREEALLEKGASSLRSDAELRVFDELQEVPAEAVGTPTGPAGLAWPVGLFLVFVILTLPPALYHFLGSYEDVVITEELGALDPSSRDSVEALVESIVKRSKARPANADYHSILGDYYTAQGAHDQALASYEQLLVLFPESPEILARAAQAEYLQGDRSLSTRARLRAEAALAADPAQRTALGTLGMAAFEAGNYAEAVSFWERLLALEPPGSEGSQMLATLIAEARTQGNLNAGEPSVLDDNVGVGAITVSVSLPEGVTETEGVVFVVARPAGSEQRMPTAVVRRGAGELPLSVTLDDSNSMAGQTLSSLSAVDIEVQLSPTGQPGRQNASWVAAQKGVSLAPGAKVALTLKSAE